MDFGWLEPNYDDEINQEIELTLNDAVEMIDDSDSVSLDGPMNCSSEPSRCEEAFSSVEEMNAISARAYEAKPKMDPVELAELKKIQRRMLWRARMRRDPIAHAELKRKDRERARVSREERRKNPIAYAEFKRKHNERRRKLRTERNTKDSVAHAQAKVEQKNEISGGNKVIKGAKDMIIFALVTKLLHAAPPLANAATRTQSLMHSTPFPGLPNAPIERLDYYHPTQTLEANGSLKV